MSDPDPLAAAKDELRDAARRRRAGISRAQRLAAGEALARHGKRFLTGFPGGTVIAAYWPIATEIDCRFLMTELDRAGFHLALPEVRGPDSALGFRRWGPGDPLVLGPHGTQQPAADAPLVMPDVILCPLLAYDADGYRLGYGGGYYDRTLAAMPRARALGVGFSVQGVDLVPHNANDRPVEVVLNETGAFICAAREKTV